MNNTIYTVSNSLANYATKTELSNNYYDKTGIDSSFNSLDEKITTVSDSLTNYSTITELSNNYYDKTNIDSSFNSLDEKITTVSDSLTNYSTITDVDTKIANVSNALTNYSTVDHTHETINNALTVNGDLTLKSAQIRTSEGRLKVNQGIEMLDPTSTTMIQMLLGNSIDAKKSWVWTYKPHETTPTFGMGFWNNNGDLMTFDTNHNIAIDGKLTVNDYLYVPTMRLRSNINVSAAIFDVKTGDDSYTIYMALNGQDEKVKIYKPVQMMDGAYINAYDINCSKLTAPNIYTKNEVNDLLAEIAEYRASRRIQVYYSEVGVEDMIHINTIEVEECPTHYMIEDDTYFPDAKYKQYPYNYKVHTTLATNEKYICLRVDNSDLYTYRDDNWTVATTFSDPRLSGDVSSDYLPLLAFNGTKITNLANCFLYQKNMISIDFGDDFDTSRVNDMVGMFAGCDALISVDLSGLDTRNVMYMKGVFSGCDALTSVNLSGLDTSNVIQMNDMFHGCVALTSVNLCEIRISIDTEDMFYNCSKLTTIYLSQATFENIQSKLSGSWTYDSSTQTATKNSSQTITHATNVSGEIGTFCETNGGIYTGYDKIAETDCICQVVQANTLSTKIVGIICSEDKFASHGDVLVKVVPGTYKLGDILCPDISGLARVATETEKQFMMLNAIPRPKITSLDTKIDNTVACFIV